MVWSVTPGLDSSGDTSLLVLFTGVELTFKISGAATKLPVSHDTLLLGARA